jgi:hypothetical protein
MGGTERASGFVDCGVRSRANCCRPRLLLLLLLLMLLLLLLLLLLLVAEFCDINVNEKLSRF